MEVNKYTLIKIKSNIKSCININSHNPFIDHILKECEKELNTLLKKGNK